MITEILLSSMVFTFSQQACEVRCRKVDKFSQNGDCPKGMKSRECKEYKKALGKQDFSKECLKNCLKAESRQNEK